ncbi:hypothetical protein DEM27_08320 [Metarhizobium album]|uniref:Uncharacterized protein n=1 Tax=Metarhizobium album TaxID=2182425 RepID=A0A2U2DSV1_9HYPH|nr:hypothetical protein [Rhizobium album]PWE56393.1 hypothetical protein DEM27_08320 [Rhizobium album]
MTAMIEKVARAIFAADWPKDDWGRFGEMDHVRERYRAMARAAIDAMKEPSEAMRAAGMRRGIDWEYGKTGHPDNGPILQSEASYIAMIQAALETTP